ncbi:MAG: hypothetical protein L0Z62_36300, partial [Gemmataceae bacterium]|nr:hypothetical protein [Gemmataceae bacterium]
MIVSPTATNGDTHQDASPPAQAVQFMGAIFGLTDPVLLRFIETWTEFGKKRSRVAHKLTKYRLARDLQKSSALWASMCQTAEKERANQFVGVCPRFKGNEGFDDAFQIRTVRVLWADIDHCTPEEAIKRCEAAGLPRPSVIVRSGHGVHVYWILAEPYLIDDVGAPPRVFKEFVDQGPEKKNYDGKLGLIRAFLPWVLPVLPEKSR